MGNKKNEKCLSFFFILIVLLSVLIQIIAVDAQPSSSFEGVIEIEIVDSITSNLSPLEIRDKLITKFLMSSSIGNPENESVHINILQGLLSFNTPSDVFNVRLYENENQKSTKQTACEFVQNS